jgi:hypothetical protein
VRPKAGQPRSGCAIDAAVEVIGDRWSLLFQRDRMNRRRIDGRRAVPAAPQEESFTGTFRLSSHDWNSLTCEVP